MSRSGPVPRCPRCALHLPLCICADVTPLAVSTRVIVIQHVSERARTSNSGRLAALGLTTGEVRVRGAPDVAFEAGDLIGCTPTPLVLYPMPGARLLTAEDGPDATLLVPDGNWRQARKLMQREPALRGARPVRLPPGPPSRYRLRSHPDPHRISTFEAIARALGILEGPDVRRQLELLFDRFVERTLWTRGDLKAAAVTGGIPDIRW